MHQIGSVLGEERVIAEISTETSGGDDDRSHFLVVDASLFVVHTSHLSVLVDQAGCLCLGDNLSPFAALGDLLDHLNQSVGDGHTGEALLSTVSTGSRVTT